MRVSKMSSDNETVRIGAEFLLQLEREAAEEEEAKNQRKRLEGSSSLGSKPRWKTPRRRKPPERS